MILTTGLVACQEDALDVYSSAQSSIYFGMKNTNTALKNVFVDTTRFTFADFPVTDTTLQLVVNVLGNYSEEPRAFKYEVVEDGTTAIAATQYELLEDDPVVLGKAIAGNIPVRLKFDIALENTIVYLKLRLKANENFDLLLDKEYVDIQNGQCVNLLEHVIVFTAQVQAPQQWSKDYFGVFSAKKYRLINQLCNKKPADWENLTMDDIEPMWVVVRNYLQEKMDKDDPLYEDEKDAQGNQVIMTVKGLVIR